MPEPQPVGGPGREPERYYVDYWDMCDRWGWWGSAPERLFDSIEAARAGRDRLNADLPEGNKSVGEHWGIIDRTVCAEIECPRLHPRFCRPTKDEGRAGQEFAPDIAPDLREVRAETRVVVVDRVHAEIRELIEALTLGLPAGE
jgi:hypothetical protein